MLEGGIIQIRSLNQPCILVRFNKRRTCRLQRLQNQALRCVPIFEELPDWEEIVYNPEAQELAQFSTYTFLDLKTAESVVNNCFPNTFPAEEFNFWVKQKERPRKYSMLPLGDYFLIVNNNQEDKRAISFEFDIICDAQGNSVLEMDTYYKVGGWAHRQYYLLSNELCDLSTCDVLELDFEINDQFSEIKIKNFTQIGDKGQFGNFKSGGSRAKINKKYQFRENITKSIFENPDLGRQKVLD